MCNGFFIKNVQFKVPKNLKRQFYTEDAPSEVPKVTTQFSDAYGNDVTTEEVLVATTDNDVAKIPGTSDDTATVNNSKNDPSNARCQDLIENFEANEDQLKQYYKNGHATKVLVSLVVCSIFLV